MTAAGVAVAMVSAGVVLPVAMLMAVVIAAGVRIVG